LLRDAFELVRAGVLRHLTIIDAITIASIIADVRPDNEEVA